MTRLERCALLEHPWRQTACPGWFLCPRCGALRVPDQMAASFPRGQGSPMSQGAPSPQRGGQA
jgi:hypothetical protein